MAAVEQTGIVERITELCEKAITGTNIEIVEVQLRGAGKARLLRIYIDKPGGVTHDDCELVSRGVGQRLDDDNTLPEDSYTLEISSPGVDRALSKRRDFERVVGQKIKVALQQPLAGQTRFEGKLNQLAGEVLELEIANGEVLHVPLDRVQKANLKFEW